MISQGGLLKIVSFVVLAQLAILPAVSLGQTDGYADGPEPVGSLEFTKATQSLWDATSVSVHGDYMYVALSSHGLLIVDISDVTSLEIVGQLDFTQTLLSVEYGGGKVLVGAGSNVGIVDITDPTTPVLESLTAVGSSAYGITYYEGYTYVAAFGRSLRILQGNNTLHDPIADYNSYWCTDVVVSGDYAYVATQNSGLTIWDVSDKSDPQIIGEYGTGRSAWSIDFYDGTDKVVIGGSYGMVIVFDVSTKTAPEELGYLEVTGDIRGLKVEDDIAIGADYSDGVISVDCSNGDPVQHKRMGPSGVRGADLVVDSSYVYGACGFSGVYIWDLDEVSAAVEDDSSSDVLPFDMLGVFFGLPFLAVLAIRVHKRRT